MSQKLSIIYYFKYITTAQKQKPYCFVTYPHEPLHAAVTEHGRFFKRQHEIQVIYFAIYHVINAGQRLSNKYLYCVTLILWYLLTYLKYYLLAI